MSATLKTVEQAHAAGRRDGEQGLGPLPPRNGAPGSIAHRLRAAYMQSYRDALVARVGIPERRRNPRAKMIYPPKLGDMVSVYGRPAKVVKLLGMGTVEAERDGKRYRVSGLPLVAMPVYKPFDYSRRRKSNSRKGKSRTAKRARTQRTSRRAPRGKKITVTTQASTKTVRQLNRRSPRALIVLYATKPGLRRLKYVGRGKFAERGRAKLFPTLAHAAVAARILKDLYPKVLRGWTLKAQ